MSNVKGQIVKEVDNKFISRGLRECFEYAMANSDDTNTKNAAILVDRHTHQVLARASNTLPVGMERTTERLSRPGKYTYMEHAERNLVYTCARNGISMTDHIVICPFFSCIECTRALIQVRPSLIIGSAHLYEISPPRWKDQITESLKLYKEVEIPFIWHDEKVGSQLMFDDKLIDV